MENKQKIQKCDCKESSCKVGCTRNHTHKTFGCNICNPVQEIQADEELIIKGSFPNSFLTGKESDNDTYSEQVHVISKLEWKTQWKELSYITTPQPIWERIYMLPRWIYLGIYYKYPLCCVFYFCKMCLLGLPPAMFDSVMKGKEHDLDYVPCDKCYLKLKKHRT